MRTEKQKRSNNRSWVIFSLTAMVGMLQKLEENNIRNWAMKERISYIRQEVEQLLRCIRDQKISDPNNYLNHFYQDLKESNQKDVKYGCEDSNS